MMTYLLASTDSPYIWRKLYFCIYTCWLRNARLGMTYSPRDLSGVVGKRLYVILKWPYDLSLFLKVVFDLFDRVFASVELPCCQSSFTLSCHGR
jgi:hypothetical protein